MYVSVYTSVILVTITAMRLGRFHSLSRLSAGDHRAAQELADCTARRLPKHEEQICFVVARACLCAYLGDRRIRHVKARELPTERRRKHSDVAGVN